MGFAELWSRFHWVLGTFLGNQSAISMQGILHSSVALTCGTGVMTFVLACMGIRRGEYYIWAVIWCMWVWISMQTRAKPGLPASLFIYLTHLDTDYCAIRVLSLLVMHAPSDLDMRKSTTSTDVLTVKSYGRASYAGARYAYRHFWYVEILQHNEQRQYLSKNSKKYGSDVRHTFWLTHDFQEKRTRNHVTWIAFTYIVFPSI